MALGAPSIRVWAGEKNRGDADEETVERVVRESLRCADLAAGEGISITFEFHGGTLTDTGANARRLAGELAHPNIHFCWQPSHGFAVEKNLLGLEGLLSSLLTIHVFHWTVGSYEKNLFDESEWKPRWPEEFLRHPLFDGVNAWRSHLACAASSGRRISALLEFVRGDSPSPPSCANSSSTSIPLSKSSTLSPREKTVATLGGTSALPRGWVKREAWARGPRGLLDSGVVPVRDRRRVTIPVLTEMPL